jgi:hypothetical protein
MSKVKYFGNERVIAIDSLMGIRFWEKGGLVGEGRAMDTRRVSRSTSIGVGGVHLEELNTSLGCRGNERSTKTEENGGEVESESIPDVSGGSREA